MTATGEAAQPRFRREPLPTARAVLWGPAGSSPSDPLVQPYPIFLQQSALKECVVHSRSAPTKGLLGFLLGALCECPESGVRFVLIDHGLRVGAEMPDDRTSSLLAKVWPRLQEQLASQRRQVLGWYHTHPTGETVFSREDIGSHLMYFTQPWQVGLVLGTEGGKPAAGWFRVSAAEDWASVRLPFYEVLAADAIDASGKRHSHVDWANFRPYRAASPAARKSVATPAPAPRATPPPPAAPRRATPPPPPPRPRPAPPPSSPTSPELPEPQLEEEPVGVPAAADMEASPPAAEEEQEAAEESAVAEEPAAVEEPAEVEEPAAAEEPAPVDEAVAAVAGAEPPVAEEPPPEEPPARRAVPPISRPSARVSRSSFTLERPEPARPAARKGRFWLGAFCGLLVSALAVAAAWYLGYVRIVWPLPAQPGGGVPAAAVAPPPAESTATQTPPADTAARVPAQSTTAAAPAQPAAAQPAPAQQRPAQQPSTQAPAAPVLPQPVAPPVVQVNPALVTMDLLADSMLTAVRRYREQSAVFDQGQRDCAALSRAMAAADSGWAAYTTRGKPPGLVLDPQRATRDQSLRAQMDTIRSHFSSAGCPRVP